MNEIPKEIDIGTLKHTMSRRLTDPKLKENPLVKFIEYENCVLDDLHLFLRVTDKLYDLFIQKCIRVDQNDGSNLALRKNLAAFLKFLQETCKIKNAYYVANNKSHNGKIHLRTFNGNERMRIFQELYDTNLDNDTRLTLSLENLLPTPKNIEDTFKKEDLVWSGFYHLYTKLKNFPTQTTIEERKILTAPIKVNLKY
jgi:hypothetical protein